MTAPTRREPLPPQPATSAAATVSWTTLLFSLSVRMGDVLADTLGAWRWVGFVGFAVFIVLAGRAAASLQESR